MNSPRFRAGDRVEITPAAVESLEDCLLRPHYNPATVVAVYGDPAYSPCRVHVQHDGAYWLGGTFWTEGDLRYERNSLGSPEPHPVMHLLIEDLQNPDLLRVRNSLDLLADIGRDYPGRYAAAQLRDIARTEAARRGLASFRSVR
jgi:hypothetical protein